MKRLLTFIVPLLFCTFVFSQDLVVKSGSKGLYLEHKVAPKEGLFPIGRMYNVHPRHIANFNNIDFNKGLAIGQLINVPLTDTNFKQTVNKGVPVYYNAAEKESLANISVKSKAQISNLRAWNNLTTDNMPAGTKLIVGFLITNEMQDRIVAITPKTLSEEESVSNVKKSEDLKKQIEEPKKDLAKNEPIPNKEAEVKKEEPRKPEPEESVSNVKKSEELKKQVEEPKKDLTKTEPVNKEPEVKKEESKKTEPVVVKQPETANDDGTGYFRNNFFQQLKTSPITKDQTVTSSIFKTSSGWQDGKYYLLMNGVEPGTIVKITNPGNSKIVFAKVLYAMDKIRQNQGVDVRISDAAAATLSVAETDKFILKVNY
ncbi:MAG TPA: LysM peptidoglycan-binding domain-containing protein [Chitinophagaceae bacterium]|nr:LysM peptidoglycan-binding domain-containing protein [Chitinophagaceae bacterium]